MGEKLLAQRLLALLHGTYGRSSREAGVLMDWALEQRDWLWPRRSWSDAPAPGLFGRASATSLDWETLPRLAAEIPTLEAPTAVEERLNVVAALLELDAFEREVLRSAVLLPPGTGKTEFARTLAASAGAALFAVGEADIDGEEPSRCERLHALKRGQRLLARRGGSVLLFDEMEDLFAEASFAADGGRRAGSGRSRRAFVGAAPRAGLRPQRPHDVARRAAGEAMKQQPRRSCPDAERRAAIIVGGAAAHAPGA